MDLEEKRRHGKIYWTLEDFIIYKSGRITAMRFAKACMEIEEKIDEDAVCEVCATCGVYLMEDEDAYCIECSNGRGIPPQWMLERTR